MTPAMREETRRIVRQWMTHPDQLNVLMQFYPNGFGEVLPGGSYSAVAVTEKSDGTLKVIKMGTYKVR